MVGKLLDRNALGGVVAFHISIVSTGCLYMIKSVFTLKSSTNLSLHLATIWGSGSMIVTIGEMYKHKLYSCSQVLKISRVSMHKTINSQVN